MDSARQRVSRLAEVAEISPTAGRSYLWDSIESALGVRLPSDYKLIAESFPRGWFRMFAEVWLPESADRLLSDFALDIMDVNSGPGFPFSPFPQPGGLMLCGSLRCPGYIYWVTGPGDPDEWPLVLLDEDYEHWERFQGSLCDFLTEVAVGRFDASRFKDQYQWNGQMWIDISSRPVFGTDPFHLPHGERDLSPFPPIPPGPDSGFWERLRRDLAPSPPVSQILKLRELLGPPPEKIVPAVNWEDVRARLGVALPSDYREFIDVFGPGMVGSIRILAPGAPEEFDIFAFMEQKYAQVRMAERDARHDVPCHPEDGGVIAWGVTPGGFVCAWAPMEPDPDKWLSIVIYPKSSMTMHAFMGGISFSGMLVRYIRHDSAENLVDSILPEDRDKEINFISYGK